MAAKLSDMVRYVAAALVDDPDAVEVTERGSSEEGTTLELRVNPDDRGKVIGKKGRVAHTLRTLLAAAAGEGPVPNLEIVD